MNNEEINFDKNFRLIQRVVMCIFGFVFLMIAVQMGVFFYCGAKIYQGINKAEKEGLKNYLNEIWEGPDVSQ